MTNAKQQNVAKFAVQYKVLQGKTRVQNQNTDTWWSSSRSTWKLLWEGGGKEVISSESMKLFLCLPFQAPKEKSEWTGWQACFKHFQTS